MGATQACTERERERESESDSQKAHADQMVRRRGGTVKRREVERAKRKKVDEAGGSKALRTLRKLVEVT